MTGFRKNFRKRLKFIVSVAIISVIIIEWLTYSLTAWIKWTELPNSVNSVKILAIADPQLLGKHFTGGSLFGFISRWDSDRFVQKTFSLTYEYVQPDIIIFLGDLFDEGATSSDKEYSSYLHRFRSVFKGVDFNKTIFLPGDNDVGGEDELFSSEKLERFDRYFKPDIVIRHRFIEFVKVNFMARSSNYTSVPPVLPGVIRVVLSHVPLTPVLSSYISKVLPHLQPHMILSAHEHKSFHLVADRKSGDVIHTAYISFPNNGSFAANLTNSETHEIMVPTCSYRMGTEDTGYGVLYIGPKGSIWYTVLWLPSRLQQLYIYIALGVFFLLFLLLFPVWNLIDHIFCTKSATPFYGKMAW